MLPASLGDLTFEIFSDDAIFQRLSRVAIPALDAECADRRLGICMETRMEDLLEMSPGPLVEYGYEPHYEVQASPIRGLVRTRIHAALLAFGEDAALQAAYRRSALRGLERILGRQFEVVLCQPGIDEVAAVCEAGQRGQARADMLTVNLSMFRSEPFARLTVQQETAGISTLIETEVPSPALRVADRQDMLLKRVAVGAYVEMIDLDKPSTLTLERANLARAAYINRSLPRACYPAEEW